MYSHVCLFAILSHLTVEPTDTSDVLGDKLSYHWSRSRLAAQQKAAKLAPSTDPEKLPRPSLFAAVARAYGGPYLIASALKLGNDCLSFAQPQLLRLLLRFIASYRTDSPDPVSMRAAKRAVSPARAVTLNTNSSMLVLKCVMHHVPGHRGSCDCVDDVRGRLRPNCAPAPVFRPWIQDGYVIDTFCSNLVVFCIHVDSFAFPCPYQVCESSRASSSSSTRKRSSFPTAKSRDERRETSSTFR